MKETLEIIPINERQKRDPDLGQLLNELRVDRITDKSIALLQNSVIKCTAIEKFSDTPPLF